MAQPIEQTAAPHLGLKAQMLTPVVLSLMIANTLAASGAMFAARQISAFEVSGRREATEANTSKAADEIIGIPADGATFRAAASLLWGFALGGTECPLVRRKRKSMRQD